MAFVNEVKIQGRLTRDPEVRVSRSGLVIADESIAVNHPSRDPEKRETSFFHITGFDRVAEKLGKMEKGYLVEVRGYLKEEKWKSPEQTIRRTVKIIATEVVVISTPKEKTGTAEPLGTDMPSLSGVLDDSDIPF